MMASELIKELETLVAVHGDKQIYIDDTWQLRPLDEVDVSAEEDEGIILWWE